MASHPSAPPTSKPPSSRPTPAPQLQIFPRLLSPRGAAHDLLPPALFATHNSGDFVGRLICLGAAEREDVNRAICGVLGSNLLSYAAKTPAGARAARGAVREGGYVLTNPDIVTNFAAPSLVDVRHPQRPIMPTRELQALCQDVLDLYSYRPDQGFVGQAVNLVHMTEEQLQITVDVPAADAGARGSAPLPGLRGARARGRRPAFCTLPALRPTLDPGRPYPPMPLVVPRRAARRLPQAPGQRHRALRPAADDLAPPAAQRADL